MVSLARGQLIWNRGENLANYLDVVMKQPLLDGAQPMISAHQLCSCRMGNDPATSVADSHGELRDVKGVWIGDGSACPTALGANPMVTIMALAERTADYMINSSRPSTSVATGVPDMAVNVIRGMTGMMMNPMNLFREMTAVMTNPMNLFSLGERLLSGRVESGVSAKSDDVGELKQ
jgi:hypothetical protein